jgi:hypothetical protein
MLELSLHVLELADVVRDRGHERDFALLVTVELDRRRHRNLFAGGRSEQELAVPCAVVAHGRLELVRNPLDGFG